MSDQSASWHEMEILQEHVPQKKKKKKKKKSKMYVKVTFHQHLLHSVFNKFCSSSLVVSVAWLHLWSTPCKKAWAELTLLFIKGGVHQIVLDNSLSRVRKQSCCTLKCYFGETILSCRKMHTAYRSSGIPNFEFILLMFWKWITVQWNIHGAEINL